MVTFAVITCSDSRSERDDTAGALLFECIESAGWVCCSYKVVPDERQVIGCAIAEAADDGVDVVLTCGGTGLGPRDVTPDATRDVCEREVPGIAEGMRAHSIAITSRAMLSRAVCMQRGRTLVVNLPGSKKAAQENWEALEPVLEHAVSMMASGGH